MSQTKENRKLIIAKLLQNPLKSQRQIARDLKLPQSTVNDVIRRYKETQSVERKQAGGQKAGIVNQKLASKVIRYANKNPNASLREMSEKFSCSRSWVHKVLKLNNLKAYHVQKCANRNDQQALRAKTRARKLYDGYFSGKKRCVVMDDETYVIADFQQLPGRSFYRSVRRFGVAKIFKYKPMTKFPTKYMVWQAICSCGERSAAYIAKGTLKADSYISECLKKRLLPFLNKHHVKPLFWPDLASIHYSRVTLAWYEANNVDFVPVEANPPNCPHLRPIEKYWALIKQKLRKSQKTASNRLSFAKLWAAASKKVPNDVVKRLMNGLGGKVNRFSREDPKN